MRRSCRRRGVPAGRRSRLGRGSRRARSPRLAEGHLPVPELADALESVLGRLHRGPGKRLRRDGRLVAGLFAGSGSDLVERRAEVEVEELAALFPQAGAKLLGGVGVADDDAVVAFRLLARDEALRDVRLDVLDGPVERVLPAAAAGGPVDEDVARLHLHLVAL